jgi:hypothetical protein
MALQKEICMTQDEHRALLQQFEVDRLLTLLTIEAKKHHDGHYAIFAFTAGYKVALGTPDLDVGTGRSQLRALRSWSTLKAAVVEALVQAQAFETIPAAAVA